MFQSYPADAYALKPELGQYEPTDVTDLSTERHEALCKPATQSKDTFKFTTNPPLKPLVQSNQQAIIEHTRARYSRKPQTQPSLLVTEPLRPTKDTPEVHESHKAWGLFKKINKVAPKAFATAQDKILHHIRQAGYLTTPQIISLCYGHLSHNPASQKVSASNDLKKLQEKKLLKELSDRRPKIYYAGNRPNVTAHDLALRDLFIKIELSNFEIAEIDFSLQLGKLNPDLRVDFIAEDGSVLQTFWEYDTGTEPLAELVSKVQRYEKAKPIESLVVFVFETQARLDQARKVLTAPFCIRVALPQFAALTDPVFFFSNPDKQNTPQPLFG